MTTIFSWEPALCTPMSMDRVTRLSKKKPFQFLAITVNIEHKHEDKSCSACPEDSNFQRISNFQKISNFQNFSNFQKFSNFQIFSGSQLLSDFQTFFKLSLKLMQLGDSFSS